ncbi:MAG TPA: hypothetical protein VIC58_11825 [Actinomycetota bacterium]
MPIRITLGFTLIGLGLIAAGLAGLRLPAGDRIAAALTLVVGGGVGVITLAIGANVVDDFEESTGYENVFLLASALGLGATLASIALLRRRSGDRAPSEGPRPSEG